MIENADVVVVGGGVMGLSVAYQLARRSNLKIILLEKGAGIGEGSTGTSSAVCRYRYSFDEMVRLARDGINTYTHWSEFTGVKVPRAEYHNDGVLWMPGQDLHWAAKEHKRMTRLGVKTEVLDDQMVSERYPGLSLCTIAPDRLSGEGHDCETGGQHYFESGGGYIDPVAVAEDLAEACRREDVDIRYNICVDKVESLASQVTGVRMIDGEVINTPRVVNAAGPWCNRLFSAIGLEVPWTLEPTRVQILYLDRPEELKGSLPVCEDFAGGIYFCLQNRGQQIVVGSLREEDEQERVDSLDKFNRFADDEFLHPTLHALHHRLPDLPYRGKVRGYCGLYTMNREDVHPIVGETPVEGFFVVNGFSGHGFKLAPAIGALLARQITGEDREGDPEIPDEFLAYDRAPLVLESKSVLA